MLDGRHPLVSGSEARDDTYRSSRSLAEKVVDRIASAWSGLSRRRPHPARRRRHWTVPALCRAGSSVPSAASTQHRGADAHLAARQEISFTLRDGVLHRTGLGTLGHPGRKALRATARLMAEAHGWNDARIDRELAQTEHAYRTADTPGPDETPHKKRLRLHPR